MTIVGECQNSERSERQRERSRDQEIKRSRDQEIKRSRDQERGRGDALSLAEEGLGDGLDEVGALEGKVEGGRVKGIVLEDESVALEEVKVAAGSVRIKDLGSLFIVAGGVDGEKALSVDLEEVSDALLHQTRSTNKQTNKQAKRGRDRDGRDRGSSKTNGVRVVVEHVSEGDEGELSIEGPGACLNDHEGPDVLIISEGGEEVVFLLRSRLR